jgi:hypothetical protein
MPEICFCMSNTAKISRIKKVLRGGTGINMRGVKSESCPRYSAGAEQKHYGQWGSGPLDVFVLLYSALLKI